MASSTTPTNWLSFSLSPMEMLRSSNSEAQFMSYDHHANSSEANSPHYLVDNFFPTGWTNINPNQSKECHQQTLMNNNNNNNNMTTPDDSSSIYTSYIQPSHHHHHHHNHNQNHQTHPVPKLEDFFSDSSPIIRYSDTQTADAQDSSTLTQIYDQSNNYFNDHHQHQHQAIAAFQAFSTNSGSEVDDSGNQQQQQPRHQLTEFGQIESAAGTELGFSRCNPTGGALSLGVNTSTTNNNNNNNKAANNNNSINKLAIVSSDNNTTTANSDCTKKIADTFGQRTSIYRGVTRHRWTGRYEAHLWDNSCRREGQARKGRQGLYLTLSVSNYSKELEDMKVATKQEFIASLRRKSSGFSRGASIYRGVTRHHQQGRWQARIGRVAGNKDLYLGTFATEEEAAEAYDIAAIKFRGLNAVTNFEMNRYDVEAIMQSALPIGGAAKRLKISLEAEQKPTLTHDQRPHGNINFSQIQPATTIPCGIPFDAAAFYHQNLMHHLQQTANMGPTADSADSTSSMTTSMNMNMLPQPTEFFLWQHHQSY
ncbi:hypothetical protein ACFE04_017793 [Oxalis oulophora]